MLTRRYSEGETLTYHMRGVNDNAGNKKFYQTDAKGVVRRGAEGYYEEFKWSNLKVNGNPVRLDDQFRQVVSLAPDYSLSIPNMSKVHPRLVAPVCDLLNFYADLQLAASQRLLRAGDHVYVNHGKSNSWADGRRFQIAEDAIDFDVTLESLEASQQLATVIIRHVPPRQAQIRTPAEWMRVPVAAEPNNWVQVEVKDQKYIAAVGNEVFEVELKVSLVDGRILSGTMHNPVEVLERECTDAALTSCGEPKRYRILRQIEIKLAH